MDGWSSMQLVRNQTQYEKRAEQYEKKAVEPDENDIENNRAEQSDEHYMQLYGGLTKHAQPLQPPAKLLPDGARIMDVYCCHEFSKTHI